MDCGEKVVRFDNVDGDGANGYGHNGTLSWAQTWTTPYTTFSTVNAPANPAAFYTAQSSGNLAEISNSVFYNNNDYAEADARGVFAAANNNVKEPSTMPIRSITRASAVVKGGKIQEQVVSLDPRPAGDALSSSSFAPRDGFFSQANFRGAFRPGSNWLIGWSASDAFGFLAGESQVTDLGMGLGSSTTGEPLLSASGPLSANSTLKLEISNLPSAPTAGILIFSADRFAVPLFGGTLVPNILAPNFILPIAGAGSINLSLPFPDFGPGVNFYWQAWVADANGPFGWTSTNAIRTVTQ
jgi:hypothetical protein